MRRSLRIAAADSLATPRTQHCGELPGRLVFGRRIAHQAVEVLYWSDPLPGGQFLQGWVCKQVRSGIRHVR